MVQKARGLSGAFFLRALISFMKAPPSGPNHLPVAPPPNTLTLGDTMSTSEFGGNTNVHCIADFTYIFLGERKFN